MEYLINSLKQYVDFSGVATRKEYWMYILFIVIISIVLAVVDSFLGMNVLSIIFSLATLIPNTSIATRRLHDTNRSGWWQLIALIPLIGIIVLIVFLVQESKNETRYG